MTAASGLVDCYLEAVTERLKAIAATEQPAIATAGQKVAAHVVQDRIVYMYGPSPRPVAVSRPAAKRAVGVRLIDEDSSPTADVPVTTPWSRPTAGRRGRHDRRAGDRPRRGPSSPRTSFSGSSPTSSPASGSTAGACA